MEVIKNEKTAEIVGLCFGDGSLTKRHSGKNKGKLRFQMRGSITEDREHYDDYVKPLFDRVIGAIPTTIYNGKKPYYGISTESGKICNYLVSLGIPVGIKNELIIPEWILQDRNYMKGFLRGFFDTDGSIFCQKSYNVQNSLHRLIKISFGSSSKKLICDIHTLLNKVEIKGVIKNPLLHEEKNWKTLHILRIESNKDVERWFNIIGSNNSKHITKFEVWKRFGFCPPHTTIKQRRIILNKEINPALFYNKKEYAEVAEPGQMRKVEDINQKPCPLVGARVQIPSSALESIIKPNKIF